MLLSGHICRKLYDAQIGMFLADLPNKGNRSVRRMVVHKYYFVIRRVVILCQQVFEQGMKMLLLVPYWYDHRYFYWDVFPFGRNRSGVARIRDQVPQEQTTVKQHNQRYWENQTNWHQLSLLSRSSKRMGKLMGLVTKSVQPASRQAALSS